MTSDLLLDVLYYVQYNGVAPTIEDLNKKEEIPGLVDSLGIYSDIEPYTQTMIDEYIASGDIISDAQGRLYLLDEVYHNIANEKFDIREEDGSYNGYIRRRLQEGYLWRGKRLAPPWDNNETEGLKALRQAAELTQQALADATGVHITQIQKMEAGTIQLQNVTLKTAAALARALRIDINTLLN